MNNPEINVGIDTSQSQLDIGIRPNGEFFSVSNDETGIKEAIKRIKLLAPTRMLIEATGRLEMAFACAAYNAGLPIVVCNALTVHNFAKATGKLAKTDKLDAFTIAHYGEAMKPDLTQIKPEKLQKISDLITVRRQCLDISTKQKNRLKRRPKSVHAPLQRILKSIQKEIQWIDKQLDKAITQVPEWQHDVDILMSAHGVGKVLFVSMMSAIQNHPKLKPMYQKMVANGKPKKVALIACARKQLTMLNAMMKNRTYWEESMV